MAGRIENYLLNVESNLINASKEKFGQKFMEHWIKKLEKARKEEEPEAETTTPRFIPNLPKGEHWIRVLPSDDILRKDVEKLAEEIGLSCRIQKDGYILIYGSENKVKDFVKKMAEKSKRLRKN